MRERERERERDWGERGKRLNEECLLKTTSKIPEPNVCALMLQSFGVTLLRIPGKIVGIPQNMFDRYRLFILFPRFLLM